MKGLLEIYRFAAAALLLVSLSFLAGCASLGQNSIKNDVSPITASGEIPDRELLNVAIEVFDPGTLPDDPQERMGLSEEIRQAEAVFYAVHLKDTLQNSGYWGSVWVVPQGDVMEDLVVTGRIEYSDGERLALKIKATDARGIVWIDKTYCETCTRKEREEARMEKADAFQDLFNAVSNDLIAYRLQLKTSELVNIHRLSEMRFAMSMAERPFGYYCQKGKDGHFILTALPAQDDPMYKRVRAIRARDEMLMDVLTAYYDNFYQQLWTPYQDWRKFRSEELETMRKIRHKALATQLLGVAAIAGSVLLGVTGDDDTARAVAPVREILAAGGVAAIYTGHQMRKDAKMNEEAIKELGESLSSDAGPLLVKVKGDTLRLTGTAKEQYATWRSLLRDIYRQETGSIEDLPQIVGQENPELQTKDDTAPDQSRNAEENSPQKGPQRTK